MIANVQCLLPARLRKIRHVQLVWRHDNIFPTKRTRLECVLFSTTTVMILVHPPIWSVKTYNYQRNQLNRHLWLRQPPPLLTSRKGVYFVDHAMDDNDEPWLSETDHRTGWNKEFKIGTYRGMLYGIVLRDYPKQVVSLAKAKSVPANMREFFSWAQRHYRIDVTASTVERKTGEPASADPCPGGCKDFSLESVSSESRAKSVVPFGVKNDIRHGKTQLHAFTDTRITGKAMHTRERHIALIVELTLILFRVRSTMFWMQHVQHLRTVMKSLQIVC